MAKPLVSFAYVQKLAPQLDLVVHTDFAALAKRIVRPIREAGARVCVRPLNGTLSGTCVIVAEPATKELALALGTDLKHLLAEAGRPLSDPPPITLRTQREAGEAATEEQCREGDPGHQAAQGAGAEGRAALEGTARDGSPIPDDRRPDTRSDGRFVVEVHMRLFTSAQRPEAREAMPEVEVAVIGPEDRFGRGVRSLCRELEALGAQVRSCRERTDEDRSAHEPEVRAGGGAMWIAAPLVTDLVRRHLGRRTRVAVRFVEGLTGIEIVLPQRAAAERAARERRRHKRYDVDEVRMVVFGGNRMQRRTILRDLAPLGFACASSSARSDGRRLCSIARVGAQTSSSDGTHRALTS